MQARRGQIPYEYGAGPQGCLGRPESGRYLAVNSVGVADKNIFDLVAAIDQDFQPDVRFLADRGEVARQLWADDSIRSNPALIRALQ